MVNMDKGDIELRTREIFEIISRILDIPMQSITLDMRLEDMAQDSMQLFSLILAFEEHYDTEVDYDDLVEIEKVSEVVSYIEKKLTTSIL